MFDENGESARVRHCFNQSGVVPRLAAVVTSLTGSRRMLIVLRATARMVTGKTWRQRSRTKSRDESQHAAACKEFPSHRHLSTSMRCACIRFRELSFLVCLLPACFRIDPGRMCRAAVQVRARMGPQRFAWFLGNQHIWLAFRL